jgi:hypothetical protein
MFIIKQNDTSPAIQVQLTNSSDQNIVLNGASVLFNIKTESNKFLFSKAATVVNSALGIVKYQWTSGDTSTMGVCYGEFQVTYADNTVETFPNDGYIKIKITQEIA